MMHVPLIKPATFWIGILKVFLPERNNLAVIYTSFCIAWHNGKKISFLLRQWEVGHCQMAFTDAR